MFLDDNGIVRFESSDYVAPLHTTLNVALESVSDSVQRVVENVNLVQNAPDPIVVAHRGGRDVFPESSHESMRACADAGFWLETDVRRNADGELVCIHDATVDRVMVGLSGNVSSVSSADWRRARIKPVVQGGDTGRPMFFRDFLVKYGRDNVLVPEAKGGDVSVARDMAQMVDDFGLNDNVIMQSFNYSSCLAAVDKGVGALYLFDGVPEESPEDIVGDGIGYVGPKIGSIGSGFIQDLKDVGLKVIGYSVSERADFVDAVNEGYDGAFSDDPWWSADEVPVTQRHVGLSTVRVQRDPGGSNVLEPVSSLRLNSDGGVGVQPEVGTNKYAVMLGSFGRFSGDVEVLFTAHMLPSSSASLGVSLVGNSEDSEALFVDSPTVGQEGFTCGVNSNGTLTLWEYRGTQSIRRVFSNGRIFNTFSTGENDVWSTEVRVLVRGGRVWVRANNYLLGGEDVSFELNNARLYVRQFQSNGYVSGLSVRPAP